jgi:uncharacterized protein YbjQ (UPF0145 family)
MSTTPSNIPSESEERLSGPAFSSGLTVPDFAACLQMGLEPVGLVQGYCVMKWSWYGAGSTYMRGMGPYQYDREGAYSESFQCPHGFVAGDHIYWGQNFEQTLVESAWNQGFSSAYTRLLEETTAAGGHGVIGLVDNVRSLTDQAVVEFHLLGTAVVVTNAPGPPAGRPWSTYLAGQRLAKLIEAGFMPVSIAASMASVQVWPYCMTEYYLRGQGGAFGWSSQYPTAEIEQLSRAQMAVYRLAREHVRTQLGTDTLHGVTIAASDYESNSGPVLECTLRGNRVRRFKSFDQLDPPRATVRLT